MGRILHNLQALIGLRDSDPELTYDRLPPPRDWWLEGWRDWGTPGAPCIASRYKISGFVIANSRTRSQINKLPLDERKKIEAGGYWRFELCTDHFLFCAERFEPEPDELRFSETSHGGYQCQYPAPPAHTRLIHLKPTGEHDRDAQVLADLYRAETGKYRVEIMGYVYKMETIRGRDEANFDGWDRSNRCPILDIDCVNFL